MGRLSNRCFSASAIVSHPSPGNAAANSLNLLSMFELDNVQSDGSAMFRKYRTPSPFSIVCSIRLTCSDNSIEARQQQFENILMSTLVTRGGTRKFCKSVLRNAPALMVSIASGRFSLDNMSQFSNAYFSITCKVDGNLTDTKE